MRNHDKVFEFFKDDIYKGDFVPIDTIVQDLNGNDKSDIMILFKDKEWTDPGDFQKLEITFDSKIKIVMFNTGDWIEKPEFKKISESKSLLFINGYAYASSPQKYTIIDINELKPKVVFKDEFELVDLIDLNNDGSFEIAGRAYYSECYKDYDSTSSICSYAPFFVYEYINDTLKLNETMTEEYNFKNYVGYFGLYDKNRLYEIVSPNYNYRDKLKPFFVNMIGRRLPDASLRPLLEEELVNYSKEDLRILRNEIFAFHGYIFEDQDLINYFEKQPWYKPIGKDVTESLNKYEKQNIELIEILENK